MLDIRRPTSRWTLAALVLGLAGCKDADERIQEKQKALEEARAAQRSEAAPAQAAEASPEPVTLDAFWDDAGYLKLRGDAPCPEGIWALFPKDVPGDSPEEKKANAAKRAEWASKLKEATVLVKLRAPKEVKLGDYDAPKGKFPLEVAGSIDCTDSFGRLTIAWTSAKAITPGNSAAKDGAEVQQNIWHSEPTLYTLPMRSMAEAKEFRDKHRFDLHARLVLKLGRPQVDKKMFKTSKVSEGEISLGGGWEDWGAGRMIRAEVQGIRISTDREKTALIEKRGSL